MVALASKYARGTPNQSSIKGNPEEIRPHQTSWYKFRRSQKPVEVKAPFLVSSIDDMSDSYNYFSGNLAYIDTSKISERGQISDCFSSLWGPTLYNDAGEWLAEIILV